MRLLAALPACLLSLSTAVAAPRVITTVAGGGPDGVPAVSVRLNIKDLAVDAAGNVYFPSLTEHRIFMVDTAGTLHVVAGTGIPASLGDGGDVSLASLLLPSALAIDAAGNLMVYEGATIDVTREPPLSYFRSSLRVRRIDALTHQVTTIAGGGGAGFVSGPVPAVGAPLGLPWDIVAAPGGDLFLSGTFVEPYTFDDTRFVHRIETATGLLTHVAGTPLFSGPSDDGLPATDVFLPYSPWLETDSTGNLLITDEYHHKIRRVDLTTGLIGTFAGTGVAGFSGDGGPATAAQLYAGPMARNTAGDIFVHDLARLRKIDAATGVIDTVAGTGTAGYSGDGGPATAADIALGAYVAVDAAGNRYLAADGRIRRIDAAGGIIDTIAGNPNADYIGNGGPATQARLSHPFDLAFTPAGDLLIIDTDLSAIRRVDRTTGILSTVASLPGGSHLSGIPEYLSGLAVDPNGDVYYATYATLGDIVGVYGESGVFRLDPATGSSVRVAGAGYPFGYGGDGGPALEAYLDRPMAIAFDAAGDLYIADTGNNRIRRVDASTGIIDTVAGGGTPPGGVGDGGPATEASLNAPVGLAFGPSGDLFIADSVNNRVRRVQHASGVIETVAGNGTPGSSGDGGAATAAAVTARDVAVDAAGNLYISGDERVRRVDAVTGFITTVAGDGAFGFYGDGGPPTLAALADPRGVAVDAAGSLYIASFAAGRVRLVPPPPELTVLASPSSLWPPSHELVDVTLTVIPSGGFVPEQITLVAATSNEPDDAPGGSDGRTTGDIEANIGSDDLTVRLRAERDARGTGRVYAITYRAVDASGTEALGTGYVAVPHDRAGQVDPLELAVSTTPSGTLVSWLPVENAVAYDVARGDLGSVTRTGNRTDLGVLTCIRSRTVGTSTAGDEDGALPAPGTAWLYVVAYEDGRGRNSYGTAGADLPRISTMDGCSGP